MLRACILCACALVLLTHVHAEAQPSRELNAPAYGRPALEAETPPPSPERPRRGRADFGTLYSWSWDGAGIGFLTGAGIGLVAGIALTGTCPPSVLADLCPVSTFLRWLGIGAVLGMVIGSGASIWIEADERGLGGQGWLALLGSLVFAAAVGGVGALVGSLNGSETEGFFGAVAVGALGLAQLGSALFYFLSQPDAPSLIVSTAPGRGEVMFNLIGRL